MMRSFSKGFWLGLFFGAAAAILFAPENRPEFIEQIAQRAQQALAAGRQAAQEREQSLQERYHQIVGQAQEAVE
ncbi:MAG: YtxH domain-containing protein [Chloroflexia bacterium]|nr:YtxH domain-containing protein [Chloroflexia bacterium]